MNALKDDFEGFTEEDFKSASIHHQRKLRDYLQKYGICVQKQQRYTIARSLHKVLLKEKPTSWTEAKIIACEKKEEFTSYEITRLIDFDFGRKPQKSRALTPTFPTGPPPAGTSAAPATFASPSPTSGLSAPTLASTLFYPTQPPGTGSTSGAYMQPSKPTSAAYIQLLSTKCRRQTISRAARAHHYLLKQP